MGYYEFDARGLLFWDEPVVRNLEFGGRTYEIPLARLRPNREEREHLVSVEDQTCEVIFDKDER